MSDGVVIEELAQEPAPVESRLEQHRPELTGYAYRMLGSAFEAEDAVQEAMVRAWRGYGRFEGRAALRSWLYRITTNVCLDMLKSRERRARPMEIGPLRTPAGPLGEPRPEATWLLPAPDQRVLPAADTLDPAELAVQRESVQLAFMAALQHLPAKQRVVLILREVLQWKAAEVAELLDTSVPAVNSALQRARATLAELQPPSGGAASAGPGVTAESELDPADAGLLARYVDAFERYDMDALVALLAEDATLSMPPYDMWLRGAEHIRGWMLGMGLECQGSRLVPVAANGSAGFAQYRPSGPGGQHEAWALQVLETRAGRITALNSFLDVQALYPLFGLPLTLDSHG